MTNDSYDESHKCSFCGELIYAGQQALPYHKTGDGIPSDWRHFPDCYFERGEEETDIGEKQSWFKQLMDLLW